MNIAFDFQYESPGWKLYFCFLYALEKYTKGIFCSVKVEQIDITWYCNSLEMELIHAAAAAAANWQTNLYCNIITSQMVAVL